MYDENEGPIEQLIHLYVDGAFSRRELLTRLARHTGSIAAAMAVLSGYAVAQAPEGPSCPVAASVPADAPDLNVADIQFAGDAGVLYGHLAYPRTRPPGRMPAVIVVHENRGLVEHIKDVTRRVARAGFVAIAVDLLSRQGGAHLITDPAQQTAAYGRTTQVERLADLVSGFSFLTTLDFVESWRVGAVGFCAGGGNTWNLAVNLGELAAAVPFYGNPLPTDVELERIHCPVLAIYAELDRNLTLRTLPVINTMLNLQKTFGFQIYQGVGHAFHNDTGPNYNSAAACDAWTRTIAWFNKFLRVPVT